MKNLKIYTDEVDELAQKQIAKLLAQPAFAGAKVRIMPDVHAGKGCVIGFVVDTGTEATGLSAYAKIKPAADLKNLTKVVVITDYSGKGEQDGTEQH
mgnify:CR=1 FL=1